MYVCMYKLCVHIYVCMYIWCMLRLITSRFRLHDGGVDRHSREQHGAVEGKLEVALPDGKSLSGHLKHLLKVYGRISTQRHLVIHTYIHKFKKSQLS